MHIVRQLHLKHTRNVKLSHVTSLRLHLRYLCYSTKVILILQFVFKVIVLISQAVELWLVDKAVLPIENSVGGSIHRNYDLLLRHRLHIVGEVQLVVNHCLLGLPGVRKEELKRVVSHPQVIFSFHYSEESLFSPH